jgi:DNA-binding IclR family transcriptional regulator
MAAKRIPLTVRTRTDRDALAHVGRRGFALENQEAPVGDAGIAAPVVNRTGAVAGPIGPIGVAASAMRLLAPARAAS